MPRIGFIIRLAVTAPVIHLAVVVHIGWPYSFQDMFLETLLFGTISTKRRTHGLITETEDEMAHVVCRNRDLNFQHFSSHELGDRSRIPCQKLIIPTRRHR